MARTSDRRMIRAPCHWRSDVQTLHAPARLHSEPPRRLISCWIILLAWSGVSVSTTASRSRSNSAICASTSSNLASKRAILACATPFGGWTLLGVPMFVHDRTGDLVDYAHNLAGSDHGAGGAAGTW